jgi:hypothetical protein
MIHYLQTASAGDVASRTLLGWLDGVYEGWPSTLRRAGFSSWVTVIATRNNRFGKRQTPDTSVRSGKS